MADSVLFLKTQDFLSCQNQFGLLCYTYLYLPDWYTLNVPSSVKAHNDRLCRKGIETFLNALLSPLNAFHERWRMNTSPGLLSSHITVVDSAQCTFYSYAPVCEADMACSPYVYRSVCTKNKTFCVCFVGFCFQGNKGTKGCDERSIR